MKSLQDRIARAVEGARGSVLILSANPMHDTGGGQRSAQMALELLERGYCVVFVSHGKVTETVDLGLRFTQPRLVQTSLRVVTGRAGGEALRTLFDTGRVSVVTQVPVRAWLPVLDAARESGATTIYDCVDRWDSELGRGWYRGDVEEAVAAASDVLVASAPELVRHVERLAEREVHLLPNAYNGRIFSNGATHTRPADLPTGRVALYVGALWGGWLDWTLVRETADRLPETRFVFIGDHRGEGAGLPRNCHFLGLKPQADLPPYLAHADVAFLPWTTDAVTHATSPLKVYEFVAMGLPVVAPPLDTLAEIPGTFPAHGRPAFIETMSRIERRSLDDGLKKEMRAFSETSSWSGRVSELLDRVAHASARPHPARQPRARSARAVLSTVIPSYNHARFLPRAIESVRAQTLPVADLVVVDDGSTDGSRAVLDAHRFRGMRSIHQENRGAHEAINRAIARSSGDYVAILNSDDFFSDERMEHAWGVARATGAALVIGGVRWVDESGDDLPADHPGVSWYRAALREASTARSLRAAVLRHNVAVTTSNFFLHRALWRAVGGFRAYRYSHDLDFLLRALELCPDRVVFEPSMTDVRYRIHGSNTIAEDTGRALAERREVVRALRAPVGRVRRGVLAAARLRRQVAAAVAGSGSLLPSPPDPGEVGVRGRAPETEGEGPVARRAGDVRPLKVGIVVRSLGLGGLEEIVALLAQTLPAHAIAPSILCTHEGGPVADRLRAAGIPVAVAGGRAERWRAWLGDVRPELLSTHFGAPDVVRVLASSGAPVVETIHNTYAWLSDEGWRAEAGKLESLATTVAVSDIAARYHAERTGRVPADHVIPNAVDPARVAAVPRAFARRVLRLDPAAPVLVHLGRFSRQKNLAGLVRAFAVVEEAVPDAILVLAGPRTDRGYVREVRRARPDLFRRDAVRVVEPLAHVGTLLAAADGFVSDSFFEGWSVAASEALWAGLPLVLSECGGARELVGEGGARGHVVSNPAGDALGVGPDTLRAPPEGAAHANESALAAAMLDVIERRDDWARRAPAARRYAREQLSPHRMSGAYARLFRCLVG